MSNWEFWQEFIRVMADKVLVIILIIFLVLAHVDEKLTYAALGVFAGLITGQRFRFRGVQVDPERK